MCKIAISFNLSKAVGSSSNLTHSLGDLADEALDYLVSHTTLHCCDAVLALRIYTATCIIIICMNIIPDPVIIFPHAEKCNIMLRQSLP